VEHRLRNGLAGLSSLVTLAADTSSSRAEMAAVVRRQILAVAAVHSMLTASHYEAVPLDQIVRTVAAQAGPAGDRVRGTGPEVLVPPRRVSPVTVVLSEIVHNAAKHGALSSESGRLAITWCYEGDERSVAEGRTADRPLVLETEERDGPTVASQAERGQGLALIEEIASSELAGSAEMLLEPEGVRHRLRIFLGER